MTKTMKPSWSFTVNSTQDIDIPRILEEAPVLSKWVIITDRNGKPLLLCLRTDWLSCFEDGDQQIVMSRALCGNWGFQYNLRCKQLSGKLSITYASRIVVEEFPSKWRYMIIEAGSLLTLEDIKDELKKAEEYERRIPVRVYVDEAFRERK